MTGRAGERTPAEQATADQWAAAVAERPYLALARRALWLQVQGSHDRAAAMLQRMAAEHGAECLPYAMQAWVDTMLAHRPRPAPGQTVEVTLVDAGTGALSYEVASLPPPTACAVQLIAARTAQDERLFRALVHSVPTDQEWGRVVWAVLTTCATNIRYTVPQL